MELDTRLRRKILDRLPPGQAAMALTDKLNLSLYESMWRPWTPRMIPGAQILDITKLNQTVPVPSGDQIFVEISPYYALTREGQVYRLSNMEPIPTPKPIVKLFQVKPGLFLDADGSLYQFNQFGNLELVPTDFPILDILYDPADPVFSKPRGYLGINGEFQLLNSDIRFQVPGAIKVIEYHMYEAFAFLKKGGDVDFYYLSEYKYTHKSKDIVDITSSKLSSTGWLGLTMKGVLIEIASYPEEISKPLVLPTRLGRIIWMNKEIFINSLGQAYMYIGRDISSEYNWVPLNAHSQISATSLFGENNIYGGNYKKWALGIMTHDYLADLASGSVSELRVLGQDLYENSLISYTFTQDGQTSTREAWVDLTSGIPRKRSVLARRFLQTQVEVLKFRSTNTSSVQSIIQNSVRFGTIYQKGALENDMNLFYFVDSNSLVRLVLAKETDDQIFPL